MIDFTKARPPAQIPDAELAELADLVASTPDGLLIELGVYKGGSAWAFNEVSRGRSLHLFDTFTGIPERSEGDAFSIGAFADTSAEAVQAALPTAHLHVGIFPGTLTDDIQGIAFTHVDCDQYETCRAAIELLWPRTVSGGIMAWDDYGFPGISRAVNAAFTTEQIQFTPIRRVPYVVKP